MPPVKRSMTGRPERLPVEGYLPKRASLPTAAFLLKIKCRSPLNNLRIQTRRFGDDFVHFFEQQQVGFGSIEDTCGTEG